MSGDGTSSAWCKMAAISIAVAVHVAVFGSTEFDEAPPFVEKPKTTRMYIMPAPVVEPVVEVVAEPPPAPEPAEAVAEIESPVETVEAVDPPVEPPVEPEPEQVFEPEKETTEPEPEKSAEPESEPAPPLPDPPATVAEADSDGQFDEPPLPRRGIKPVYPLQARQEEWEGAVVCEVGITRRGRVRSAAVVGTSGYEVLDAAALRAVRQAQFQPATRGGRAVDSRVRLTVEFRLDGK